MKGKETNFIIASQQWLLVYLYWANIPSSVLPKSMKKALVKGCLKWQTILCSI